MLHTESDDDYHESVILNNYYIQKIFTELNIKKIEYS